VTPRAALALEAAAPELPEYELPDHAQYDNGYDAPSLDGTLNETADRSAVLEREGPSVAALLGADEPAAAGRTVTADECVFFLLLFFLQCGNQPGYVLW
jgi:hypothetical protein